MPVNQDLLDILVCPETKQPVTPASDEILARINQQIETGELRNRGGDAVSKSISEALVREDGEILYVVDDGIPVMLIEESIQL